jgi:predicted nucleotidyltransferase
MIVMTTDIQILHELKQALQVKFGEDIQEVILFGSRITGDASEFSDYDILIILKQKPDRNQKRKISEICYDIELQNNILIDTHIISEAELNTLRGKQPIFQRAIRKGIHV